MKFKKSMRVLSLAMSFFMLLTACGQTAQNGDSTDESPQTSDAAESDQQTSESVEETEYPEYLNLESAYPVIKDEYEGTIKLKVAFVVDPTARDWDELWVSRYLKDKYNIELEVEYITNTTLQEKKSLMLNSGDLPDMMWNMNFTTDELVKYGQEQGLFLKCDEYMNETLTPSIMHYWTDEVKRASTAPDGHVYSLPKLTDSAEVDPGLVQRLFINKAWLDELNLEMPRTLDEYVDASYAIEEADPAGVGSENLYPMGGGMETTSVTWYLLNALGYITPNYNNGAYGLAPCIRDGEVVIPVYDMEVYQEFLKLLNQFYNDGIINSNFFTIEGTEINAQMNAGQTAVYGDAPYISGITTWDEWDACYPLTSEWQSEPEILNSATVSVGGFVISANTEYPELCMRFADVFFNNQTDISAAFWGGTGEGTEYDSDEFIQGEWLEDKQDYTIDTEKLPEGYSTYSYLIEYMHGNMLNFGTYNLREAKVKKANDNGADMPAEKVYDMTNPDAFYRVCVRDNIVPYVTDGYPSIYYTDAETAQKIIDLETVIQPYVKEQVAMFITGARPLSETADFVEEMKGMGMEELVDIYKNIYDNMYIVQ